METKKPVKKFKAGAIEVSVWKNQIVKNDGQSFEKTTIRIDKHYKTKDGDWKCTSSLDVNEIPKVVLVLGEVYKLIALQS